MTKSRALLERLLRTTGLFRVAKRTLLGLETIGLQATTLSRQFLRGESWPSSRRGNVVMFHSGRSGSFVIADLLNQHPEIHWDGELFNYHLEAWRRTPRERLGEAQRLIGRRIGHHDVPFYGLEVLPSHLKAGRIDNDSFARALADLGFEYFVLLTRRNLLRKIVSHLVARERGRWHLSSAEVVPLTSVLVDVENLQLAWTKPLLEHLRDSQAEYDALRTLLSDRRCLHLAYEDDVLCDPRLAMRKICNFLRVDYMDMPVRQGRTTPQALEQVVRNFADVERVLSGTEFEWMLDEKSEMAGART